MPNQFLSPEGDLENYFVTEYWLIDQYIGDTLWAWGFEGSKLGNGDASTVRTFTPVTTFAGGTNWKQASNFRNTSAAIKTDGTLWTWGAGANGILGNASTTDVSTPVTTFAGGTNWKQVSCGNQHNAAIKTDGTLWVWGYNLFGQLGNASTTDVSTPVTTFSGGSNWKQVSCGYSEFTSAIKTDGTLWIWGGGSSGKLGNNAATNRSTPVTTFAGGTNWKQVSCNRTHVAAIKTDGTLWTWGAGGNGRLGNAVTTNTSTPVTTFTGGTNWKQVACGSQHTGAVKTDGTLWMWGSNTNSRLGTSTATGTNRSTPITTSFGGTNWKSVGCGEFSSNGLKTDNSLTCWGDGARGQSATTTFLEQTRLKQVSTGDINVLAIESGISADLPLS